MRMSVQQHCHFGPGLTLLRSINYLIEVNNENAVQQDCHFGLELSLLMSIDYFIKINKILLKSITRTLQQHCH